MGALDEYIEVLTKLPPKEMEKAVADAMAATKHRRWIPNPGPQTEAYFSEADELLYGGEAGGGKSDLIIGLSLEEHDRSLVLRRTNGEANKLFDRYEEIIGHGIGKNEQKGWKIDGRKIDIGGCQLEKDKQKRKGIPHDLKAFDELVDFTESQYLFITTWTRTTKPGQRCRIVATTNPPTSPEGMWVVRRWAAWLDPTHPNPAKSGELRWYVRGPRDEDIEVDGPGEHIVDGKPLLAKSRTFIRSTLADNPDLTRTDDYKRQLDSLPIELRQAYREGRFDVGLKDQAFQLIPTDWIRAAQDRWTERPPAGVPMCAMGVDCSGGGNDPMVLAPRYDGWFDRLITIPGSDIPKTSPGRYGAGMIVMHRRGQSCIIIVDMGGGYGGPIYEACHDQQLPVVAYKGAAASVQRTKDGQCAFYNLRTQALWRFREALDPEQPGGSPIMLPPSPILIGDLAAPTFEPVRGQHGIAIKAESKEDVCKRLGRSTNEGDAVIMAWTAGATYLTDGKQWQADQQFQRGLGRRPAVVMGRANRRR